MRKILLTAAAILMSAAMGLSSARAADDDLLIGTLLPLTGPGAATGTEQQQGVDLAIKHINAAGGVNGRMLRAVVEDSTGRPDQAVLGFNRLIELDDVQVVMSAYSSVALAIDPIAARNEILVVNSGAQSDLLAEASPFLINTMQQVRGETEVLAQFAKQELGDTAAIMYENAAAGQSGRDGFKASFEALGGTIVGDEATEFGQTNYRPALLKIRAADPDMVYIAVTQNFGVIAEQVSQIPGFPPVVGNTYSTPFFGHPGAVGWYNTSILSRIPLELKAEYESTYNLPFEIQPREYYNAVHIIAKAMKKVLDDGNDISGVNLRDAILEIGTFNSEIADISFDGSNTADRPIVIEQNRENDRLTIDFTPE